MSCRCSDISECQADLETLAAMIAISSNLFWNDHTISNRLSFLGEACQTSITPDNLDILTGQILDLHNQISSHREALLERCERERTKLERELSSMEREDEHYHEEKDSDD